MASIKLGALVADVRGQIGGVKFSRGAGGATASNSPKPINPRSSHQQARRAALAQCTNAWNATLTEVQRQSWRDYSAATAWTNKVGTSAQISGLAAFARLNCLLLMIGSAIQVTAPTSTGHAGTPTFTITANDTTNVIAVAEPATPFDKDVDLSRMIWSQYGPTNAGRLALSGQKRYADNTPGDSSTAPTFPLDLTTPLTFHAGQRVSLAGVYVDELGRVGAPYVASVIAATP